MKINILRDDQVCMTKPVQLQILNSDSPKPVLKSKFMTVVHQICFHSFLHFNIGLYKLSLKNMPCIFSFPRLKTADGPVNI